MEVAVLGLLDAFMEEVDASDDSGEFGDADDLLVAFCREIYNQFFLETLGEQIREPGASSRVRIILLRRRRESGWSKELAGVVHGYLKFCPLYDDLISGLRYERENAVSLFHVGFVPKLLDEFASWAAAESQTGFSDAVRTRAVAYERLVGSWTEGWHDRR